MLTRTTGASVRPRGPFGPKGGERRFEFEKSEYIVLLIRQHLPRFPVKDQLTLLGPLDNAIQPATLPLLCEALLNRRTPCENACEEDR